MPRTSIEPAQVVGKINLDEDPALARLGARHQAKTSSAADLLRTHPKKGGGFMQSKRLHVAGIPTVETGGEDFPLPVVFRDCAAGSPGCGPPVNRDRYSGVKNTL